MAQALSGLPEIKDPNLLVGINTADDAGVYKLNDELALVYTIDILTPVVDDPFMFGQVAATNCISDVYAMGGEPKLALNIVGFPAKEDSAILGEILRGGQEKAQEAGITVAGGHTFNSETICYGLSVVGYIHPQKIITNAGARPGDLIVLTKPIGVGTMIQAVLTKKDQGLDLKPVIGAMTTLNRDASRAMREAGADAATDITGYGLSGHMVEMAEGSNAGIELFTSKIPVHKGCLELVKAGLFEPGITMNVNSFGGRVTKEGVDPNLANIIFGSETSGGLAVVLPEKKLDVFLKAYGKPAPVIGRITAENAGRIVLIP